MVKIMENLIKMDDLGVAVFLETPISKYFNLFYCIEECHSIIEHFGCC